MRVFHQLIVLGSIALLGACSTTSKTGSVSSADDVYYSSSDQQKSPPPAVSHSSPYQSNSNDGYNSGQNSQSDNSPDYYSDQRSNGSSEQYNDPNNGNNTTNNYNNGDYYDYSYSARLRRFYTPMYGYGYYDPFYTNSYWYDYNPSSWGMSIYLGYNFWAPSFYYYNPFAFGPHFGFGISYGYGYPYYNPYYSSFYYPPYYPYYPNCGYYNPYYYNSFEGSGSYYGPRGSVSSNGGTATPSPRSIGANYQQAVAEHRYPDLSAESVRGATPALASIKSGTNADVNGGTSPVVPRLNVGGVSNLNEKPNTSESISKGGIRPSKPVSSPPSDISGSKGNAEVISTPRPSNGIISQKNERGGESISGKATSEKPVRGGGEVSPVPPPHEPNSINQSSGIKSEKSLGGDVRPSFGQSQGRSSQAQQGNSSSPSFQKGSGDARRQSNNLGGTAKPKVEQPSRNSQFNVPGYSQPGNQNNWNHSRNNNSDRTRQYREAQPRVEPRSEPKQYNLAPPEQRNYSAPGKGNSRGSGEGRGTSGGGKRK